MISHEDAAQAYVADLCEPAAIERLTRLVSELISESQCQNLVSRGTLDTVWTRHVADSAQLIAFVPGEINRPWLDLGTGAGFPGLVVAAMRPQWPVVLVESRRKRFEWLMRMIRTLDLSNCRVEARRLQAVQSFPAGVISARAFAPTARLLELSSRFSTSGTVWLLPKGRSAEQELAQLDFAQRAMFHVERSITDPDSRILVGRGASPA